MKGTRLWKPAGSPLIQGRSRRERPFATDATIAVLLGAVAGAGVWIAVLSSQGSAVVAALATIALPVFGGAVVGGLLGVWLATGFGWHPRWVAGFVLGALVASGATWWYLGAL